MTNCEEKICRNANREFMHIFQKGLHASWYKFANIDIP